MPFDRQYLYLTMLGNIGDAADEHFSFGLKFTGGTGFDAEAALPLVDLEAVAAIAVTFFEHADTSISQNCSLTSVKLAAVGTDGAYLASPLQEEAAGTGSSALRHPNQVALCISTTTPVTFGRAKAGRFYLPVDGHVVNGAGRITGAAAAATQAGIFLSGLNDEFNQGAHASTASVMSDLSTGTTRGITGVRVGDVLDTIRSRRESLVEAYSAAAVTT